MKHIRIQCLAIFFIGFISFPIDSHAQNPDTLWVQMSVQQCDSLIDANADNPNFVILDVRTVPEYNPQHLAGAINRDYYAADFLSQLDLLPKNKLYLMHCASGSRSANAFIAMKTHGFTRVVEMAGGIRSWNNNGYPTTSDFAPFIMAISDTINCRDSVLVGAMDTMTFSLTNRANDTLTFSTITPLVGSEFSTDFDITAMVAGAFDYTFHVYYEPLDDNRDSVQFVVQSNGGSLVFTICRTGITITNTEDPASVEGIKVYPNPVSNILHIGKPESTYIRACRLFDRTGQMIQSWTTPGLKEIEVSGIAEGLYFIQLLTSSGPISEKIIVHK